MLCDILRGSGSDIQIVDAAMKRYAASKEKKHPQTNAVRRAASSEAQSATVHGGAIVITKNPMQLKAFIKKKATKKTSLPSLSCRIICWNGYWNEFPCQGISIISFSKAVFLFPQLPIWTQGRQWI